MDHRGWRAWGFGLSHWIGRLKRNVAPRPGPLAAHSLPPCDSMIDRLMLNPMPVPCGLVVKNASKIAIALSGGSPTPVSLTEKSNSPFSPRPDVTLNSPPVSCIASTRSTALGSLREAPIASALPLGQVLRPSSPTLGQLRNRKQPRNLIAIVRVDAEDIPDAEVVIRLPQDPDLVSGAQVALDDDPEIGTGSQRLAEASWKGFVVHPDSEPPARDSRLGDLQDRAP